MYAVKGDYQLCIDGGGGDGIDGGVGINGGGGIDGGGGDGGVGCCSRYGGVVFSG